MTGVETTALTLATAVLAASAASDLRHLRIPNTHVLAVVAIFAASAPFALAAPEIGLRLAAGLVAFSLGFGLFALRLFGGGDVKMMAAVILLVPARALPVFLFSFSAALLLTTLGIVLLQRLELADRLGWESARTRGSVPVGVSIFLAMLALTLRAAA